MGGVAAGTARLSWFDFLSRGLIFYAGFRLDWHEIVSFYHKHIAKIGGGGRSLVLPVLIE